MENNGKDSSKLFDILNCYFYSVIGEHIPTVDELKELAEMVNWDYIKVYQWFKRKTDQFFKYNVIPYYINEAIKYRPLAKKFQKNLPADSPLKMAHMPKIFDNIDTWGMTYQRLPRKIPDILYCYFYSVGNEHLITMNAMEELADSTGLNRSQVYKWLQSKKSSFSKKPISEELINEAIRYKEKAEAFQANLHPNSYLRVPYVPSMEPKELNLVISNPEMELANDITNAILHFYFYSILFTNNRTRIKALNELPVATGLSLTYVNDWMINKSFLYMENSEHYETEAESYLLLSEYFLQYVIPVNSVLQSRLVS